MSQIHGDTGHGGTGERGNRETGEQGNRGTGEQGNRGTGEQGHGSAYAASVPAHHSSLITHHFLLFEQSGQPVGFVREAWRLAGGDEFVVPSQSVRRFITFRRSSPS